MATTATDLSKYGFLVPNQPSAPADKKSTPGQHKYYLDLCTQKRQTPIEDYIDKSFNEMSNMIEILKDLRPVSESQLNSLTKCVDRLANVGINVDINFEELTGGREGTASAVLEYLFELVNKHCTPETEPPSDKQLEYVASMYLCPSVDFESFGVERWIYLEDNMKRRPTSDEFIDTLRNKFNKSTISEFINKNREEFNEWRKTRIRPGQLKHIISLLEKHGGSQVDELTLLQFSQEEADVYIKTLLDELKVKIPTSLFKDHRELPISITTIQQAVEENEKSLKNLFFSLQMETGCEIDDIEEFLSNVDEVREYLAYLVEKDFIYSERLAKIIDENELLADMLQIN